MLQEMFHLATGKPKSEIFRETKFMDLVEYAKYKKGFINNFFLN